MKIVILTHYFPPEVGAPQARLGDFARLWAAAGHDVHVITGMPNYPTGVVPEEYRGRVRCSEEMDGYKVTRCWLYATPNEGIVKKTLGHLSFMVTSFVLGFRRIGRPDVIVVSSPTFFAIGSAWLLALFKRSKLVVEVRDLWPAIFVELGVLTNRHAIRLLEGLELAAYRAADAVVVVSEGFRDHITARGIESDKVHTIRNGVDLDKFQPATEPNTEWRSALGADDGVLALYIGAHGISQALTTIVDAAALINSDDVQFALVGDGADRVRVENHRDELGLTNVTMRASVPRDEVSDVLASADICLVTLRDIPLFTTFIPSKIFELMASGKPIIAAVAGETAEILRAAGAIVVPPEDPGALADAIRDLSKDPVRRHEMGVQGRAYVEQHFDRTVLARRYEDIFETLGASS